MFKPLCTKLCDYVRLAKRTTTSAEEMTLLCDFVAVWELAVVEVVAGDAARHRGYALHGTPACANLRKPRAGMVLVMNKPDLPLLTPVGHSDSLYVCECYAHAHARTCEDEDECEYEYKPAGPVGPLESLRVDRPLKWLAVGESAIDDLWGNVLRMPPHEPFVFVFSFNRVRDVRK